jgi:hypothetical protein
MRVSEKAANIKNDSVFRSVAAWPRTAIPAFLDPFSECLEGAVAAW